MNKLSRFFILFAIVIWANETFAQKTKTYSQEITVDYTNKKIDASEIHEIARQPKRNNESRRDCTCTIKINFKSKSFVTSVPKNLYRGQFYRIEIDSINLNKWRVVLSTEDSTWSSSIQTPTFGDIELDAIQSLITSLKSSSSSTENPLTGDGIDSLQIIPADSKIFFDSTNSQISQWAEEIDQLGKDIDSLNYILGVYELGAYDDHRYFNTEYTLRQFYDGLTVIRKSSNNLNDHLLENIKKYNFQYKVVKNTILEKTRKEDRKDSIAMLDKQDTQIHEKYESLLTASLKLYQSVKADTVLTRLRKLLFLNQSKTFLSLPFQVNGDEAKINLSIVPFSKDFNLPTYNTSFSFPVRSKFYWSVGLSFYCAGLKNERYSTLGVSYLDTKNTNYSIVKESTQNIEIGLASLLRVGFIANKEKRGNIGLHLTLGPGVSISQYAKPRLLLGTGISIGKLKNSIAIDTGVIGGAVDRKSNAYFEHRNYNQEPENVTITTLKMGWFLSIGYMFRF